MNLRRIRAAVALCLAISACEQGVSPPVLQLDTERACDASARMCTPESAELLHVEGVRVLYQRVVGHPLVSVRLSFDVRDEPSAAQLWAETLALEVLAQAGSARHDSVTWSEEWVKLGAELSASGGIDYRSLRVSAERTSWPLVWDLLWEALERPNTDEYYLDNRRRGEAYRFASAHESASTAASYEAFGRLFRGSAMNRAQEGQAALERVREPDLKEAWRALLTKQRLLVTVVGDLPQSAVREVVARDAKRLPDTYSPSFDESELAPGPEERVAVLPYPDAPTWHVRAYFKGPNAASTDYRALSLGLAVLDARLFEDVRDEAGLAYTTGAHLSFYRQSYGAVWLSTKAPDRALPLVRDLVRSLKQEGPDADELERARQSLWAEQLEFMSTPDGLGGMLADWLLTVEDARYGEATAAAFGTITEAEVAGALRTYLSDVAVVAAGGGAPLREAELSSLFE